MTLIENARACVLTEKLKELLITIFHLFYPIMGLENWSKSSGS